MNEKLKKINLPHQINNVKTFQVIKNHFLFSKHILQRIMEQNDVDLTSLTRKSKKIVVKDTILKFLLGEDRKGFGKLHNSTTDN